MEDPELRQEFQYWRDWLFARFREERALANTLAAERAEEPESGPLADQARYTVAVLSLLDETQNDPEEVTRAFVALARAAAATVGELLRRQRES